VKFASSRFEPVQQGDLDGFCGVYSVLNFFFRRYGLEKFGDDRRTALFHKMLKHLEEREQFTVRRVAGCGFQRCQIQAAFGKLAEAEGLQVKAVSLVSFANQNGAADIFQLLSHLAPDEAAMLHLDACEHWVLAHSASDQKFMVDDSSRELKPLSYGPKKVKFHRVSLSEGLVFLNAQTH
jgi:hypothetical protein